MAGRTSSRGYRNTKRYKCLNDEKEIYQEKSPSHYIKRQGRLFTLQPNQCVNIDIMEICTHF